MECKFPTNKKFYKKHCFAHILVLKVVRCIGFSEYSAIKAITYLGDPSYLGDHLGN